MEIILHRVLRLTKITVVLNESRNWLVNLSWKIQSSLATHCQYQMAISITWKIHKINKAISGLQAQTIQQIKARMTEK